MGHLPLALPVQQGRLLLRACEGNAKLPALVDAQWRALEIAEDSSDLFIADRTPLYAARRSGVCAVREELQGADAVAADGGQEAIGIIPPCPHPLRQPAADLFVVRQ